MIYANLIFKSIQPPFDSLILIFVVITLLGNILQLGFHFAEAISHDIEFMLQ